jgi:hypothetical protein
MNGVPRVVGKEYFRSGKEFAGPWIKYLRMGRPKKRGKCKESTAPEKGGRGE